MSVKEVMTSLADAVRGRYSVTNKLTVTDMIDLINSENIDVAKLIDRSITEITIPEGVTGIGAEAFRGCSQLTEVTLPNTIMSIGTNTFADCDDLEHVVCYFSKNIGGFPWGASEDIFTFLIDEIDIEGGALRFTATAPDTIIKLQYGFPFIVEGIQYKTNAMDTFEYYRIGDEIILENKDDFVLFQNESTRLNYDPEHYVYFSSNKTESGYPKVSGNILSMLGGSATASNYCFCYLFKDFKADSNPLVPDFTEMAKGCCYHMYDGARFVDDSSRYFYFTGNSDLETSCYEGMFYGTTLTERSEIKIPKSSWQFRAYYNFMKDVVGLGDSSDVIIEFESWPSDSLECTTEWLPNASVTSDAPRFQITRYLDKYIRDTSHIPSNWRIDVSTDLSCSVTTPVSLEYYSNTDMILNPPTEQLVATVSDPAISPKFYLKDDSTDNGISVSVTPEGLFTVLNKPWAPDPTDNSAEFIVCVYYAGDPLQSTHLGYLETLPHEEITVNVKYYESA